ncbi:MAG TPA: TadE/TadG family type IV pilus assembly protein [Caulobacteraceae bacterium]
MVRRFAFFRSDRGAAAAEFALVAPMFFALVFGVINFAALLFAYVNLHWATENAARCYAVNTTVCTSATTTQTYAANHYQGPGISASFVATTTGNCHKTNGTSDGHNVTGTGGYTINAVLATQTISLSSAACFP